MSCLKRHRQSLNHMPGLPAAVSDLSTPVNDENKGQQVEDQLIETDPLLLLDLPEDLGHIHAMLPPEVCADVVGCQDTMQGATKPLPRYEQQRCQTCLHYVLWHLQHIQFQRGLHLITKAEPKRAGQGRARLTMKRLMPAAESCGLMKSFSRSDKLISCNRNTR